MIPVYNDPSDPISLVYLATFSRNQALFGVLITGHFFV